jgi:integrase/recombinase XerD
VSSGQPVVWKRTPAKRKARQLAATLRQERPAYAYLKEVFRQLRAELDIVVPRTPKRLPYVPNEEEIRRCWRRPGKRESLATWCSSRHCSTPASA